MKNGNNNELLQIINLLVKKSEILLICLDSEFKIKLINQTTKSIYGWENKEVIGKSYLDECKASSIQCIDLNLFNEVLNGKTISGHINKIENITNNITVQWDIFPIQDSNKVTNLVMIGFDLVRDIKKGSYLYDIINNIPHYIFWKNRNHIFLGCNQIFSQVAKLDNPKNIVGKTDYDLPWKKSDSDAYRKDDDEVIINDKSKLNIEETQTLENGETLTLLTSKVPLHNADGEVVGVLGIYSDITEIKKNQVALQNTKHQLKGAQLISASIAHEIRTPLATTKGSINLIKGIVETICNEIEINDIKIPNIDKKNLLKLKKYINLINEKTDQCNAVINMLLAKLQSFEFGINNFDIFFAVDCIDKSLKEFIVPVDMIDKIKFIKTNNFEILGDQIMVKHVIMNFLKNAIYFIQKANKGEITIWLENKSKSNEIHFKDTAFGISEEVLPQIFKPFFTTETSTGTGIGLAFSKMVMESHQGNIICLSKEGEYTEFILSFPKYVVNNTKTKGDKNEINGML